MATERQLKECALEMIKVMNLQDGPADDKHPIVFPETATSKDFAEVIKTAIQWIEPQDKFTYETKDTIREISGGMKDVTLPDWVDEQEKPSTPLSLEQEIDSIESFKELKNLATVEPQFKPIRGRLSSYKNIDDLKEEMIWILKGDKVPDKLHKKLEDVPVKTAVENFESENVAKTEDGTGNLMDMPELTQVEDKHVFADNIIESIPFEENLIGIGTMFTNSIVTRKPFNSLFNINDMVLNAVAESMQKNGYDHAFPVIVWNDTCIDGHTRLRAADACGIEEIPILRKEFKDEHEALEYAIHNQRDRRNISDAELLRCIQVIDKPMTKQEVASKGGKGRKEKVVPTHVKTAETLGISSTKVTDARTVLADEEKKEEVLAGKKTINKAVTEIKEKKKKPETVSKLNLVCQLIRDNEGVEIPVSELIRIAPQSVVTNVLEVLENMQLVTYVTFESIKYERTKG